jgi:cell division protein FtsB
MRRSTSIVLAIGAVALVCYFFISFFSLRAQVAAKRAEVATLQTQVARQEEKNAELEQLLDSGDLDAFVEKRARDEDLGYAYPDERVYYDMSAQD